MSLEVVNELEKRHKKALENFVIGRDTIEKSLKVFTDNMNNLDPKLKAYLQVPDDLNARTLFPSLYADRFDVEQYEREKEEFERIVGKKCRTMSDTLIMKAREILDGK